jgi:Uma2 family endonuclease
MVACGREGTEKYYLTDPKLIVEVLSPSTQSIDQREKAFNYRQIPALEEYVLVSQDRCEVTIHRRLEGWEGLVIASPEGTAEFRSVDLSLPLSEIYRGVP